MWSRSVMAFQLFRFRNRRTKSVSHWMRCNDNQMRMRSKYFIIKRAAIVSHTVFCSPLFKYELWRMMEWPSSLSFIRTRMKKNHRVWNTFIANWLWWVQCDEWKSAVDVDTDDNNLNMLNAHSKSFEIKKCGCFHFWLPSDSHTVSIMTQTLPKPHASSFHFCTKKMYSIEVIDREPSSDQTHTHTHTLCDAWRYDDDRILTTI